MSTAPVRPTMPSFSCARVVKLRRCNTGGNVGLYATVTSSYAITPCDGHPGGGVCSVTAQSGGAVVGVE